jgi:hypothetical protein
MIERLARRRNVPYGWRDTWVSAHGAGDVGTYHVHITPGLYEALTGLNPNMRVVDVLTWTPR